MPELNLINLKNLDTESLLKDFLLAAHPVGSIYQSINATSPADLFGGEWQELTGVYLYARDGSHAVNSTFGAASYSHAHNGTGLYAQITNNPNASNQIMLNRIAGLGSYDASIVSNVSGEAAKTVSGVTTATKVYGATQSTTVSALPPSISVYTWKRIS